MPFNKSIVLREQALEVFTCTEQFNIMVDEGYLKIMAFYFFLSPHCILRVLPTTAYLDAGSMPEVT